MEKENVAGTKAASTSVPPKRSSTDALPGAVDRGARRIAWLGTLSAVISAAVAIAAFVVSYTSQIESRDLKLNAVLDQAWDALGGSPNTSYISGFQNSNIENARRLLRNAEAIRPDDPRINLVTAAMYLAQANPNLEEAERELREAIKASPETFDFHVNLAVTLRMQKKWSAAQREFTTAISLKPDDATPYFGLGNMFRMKGELPEAVEHYKKGIDLNRHDALIHEALGSTLLQLDDLPAGIAHLREAVRLLPTNAKFRFKLGNAYFMRSEFQNATRELEEVIRLAPGQYDKAYVNLATLMFQGGDHEKAEAMLLQALTINPNSAQANVNLGNLYLAKDSPSNAIRYLSAAIEIEPNAIRYFNLGNAYIGAGQVTEAIDAFFVATELDNEFYKVRINLGRTLAKESRFDEAIVQFEAAVRIEPENPEARNDLGILYSLMDRPDEAIEEFRTALSVNPNSPETHLNVGHVHKKMRNLRLAEEALSNGPSNQPELR